MTDSVSYAEILNGLLAKYLGQRNHIDRAERGEFKRPPEWFQEQNYALRALKAAGIEFRIISENAVSYDAWKAGLLKRETAA